MSTKATNLLLSDFDRQRLDELKEVFGTKTRAKTIKRAVMMAHQLLIDTNKPQTYEGKDDE